MTKNPKTSQIPPQNPGGRVGFAEPSLGLQGSLRLQNRQIPALEQDSSSRVSPNATPRVPRVSGSAPGSAHGPRFQAPVGGRGSLLRLLLIPGTRRAREVTLLGTHSDKDTVLALLGHSPGQCGSHTNWVFHGMGAPTDRENFSFRLLFETLGYSKTGGLQSEPGLGSPPHPPQNLALTPRGDRGGRTGGVGGITPSSSWEERSEFQLFQ